MSGKSFSVWLNNDYLPNHQEYSWIREVSSKSVKHSIEDACTAFSRFFHHQSGFPRYKKKGRSNVKMYFVRNNPKDCLCERHRIKIPTLGWVRLKEKGYIPTSKDGYIIKSGTISMKAGRYYVSALVEVTDPVRDSCFSDGVGIDLGLKNLAIISNGTVYRNINKTARIRKLEKQLRRAQRKLSRKYENLKKGEPLKKQIYVNKSLKYRSFISVWKIFVQIISIRRYLRLWSVLRICE